MIIKTMFFPSAEDERDADAQEPTRVFYSTTMSDAVMALGLIERHEERVIL